MNRTLLTQLSGILQPLIAMYDKKNDDVSIVLTIIRSLIDL